MICELVAVLPYLEESDQLLAGAVCEPSPGCLPRLDRSFLQKCLGLGVA